MKKKYILYVVIIILSLAAIIFVNNNHFLYKRNILKIYKIEEKREKSSTSNEYHITQKAYGKIKNGKYKGNKVSVINHTTTSGVYDEKLHKHSEVFVELTDNGTKAMGISQVKRDKYIIIPLVLFIDLLILVARKKGLMTLISLCFNVLLSICSIFIFSKFYKHINMIWLYLFVSILFVVSTLFLTNGKGMKTLAAILSSIASLIVSFILVFIIIKLFKEPAPYWTLDYIEAVHQYENFFFVSILLCGLGAIMDISITISSSINELIVKDPYISQKALHKSVREISKDIVGTMTNVMLFTCYTSIIPITFLMMKNNMIIGEALRRYGEIELLIVLTSCISIVLSIIVSNYVSSYILKPSRKDKEVLS